jgi:hypothetical protein
LIPAAPVRCVICRAKTGLSPTYRYAYMHKTAPSYLRRSIPRRTFRDHPLDEKTIGKSIPPHQRLRDPTTEVLWYNNKEAKVGASPHTHARRDGYTVITSPASWSISSPRQASTPLLLIVSPSFCVRLHIRIED